MALSQSIKRQRTIGRLIFERDQINVKLALLRLQLEKSALAERSLHVMKPSDSARSHATLRAAS